MAVRQIFIYQNCANCRGDLEDILPLQCQGFQQLENYVFWPDSVHSTWQGLLLILTLRKLHNQHIIRFTKWNIFLHFRTFSTINHIQIKILYHKIDWQQFMLYRVNIMGTTIMTSNTLRSCTKVFERSSQSTSFWERGEGLHDHPVLYCVTILRNFRFSTTLFNFCILTIVTLLRL